MFFVQYFYSVVLVPVLQCRSVPNCDIFYMFTFYIYIDHTYCLLYWHTNYLHIYIYILLSVINVCVKKNINTHFDSSLLLHRRRLTEMIVGARFLPTSPFPSFPSPPSLLSSLPFSSLPPHLPSPAPPFSSSPFSRPCVSFRHIPSLLFFPFHLLVLSVPP